MEAWPQASMSPASRRTRKRIEARAVLAKSSRDKMENGSRRTPEFSCKRSPQFAVTGQRAVVLTRRTTQCFERLAAATQR